MLSNRSSLALRRVAAALASALTFASCQSSTDSTEGLFTQGDPASEKRAEALVEKYINDRPAELAGIGVKTARVRIDRFGKAHALLDQTVNGVPVFGGAGMVHLNQDGSFESLTDNFVRRLRVETTPTLSAAQAIAIAVQAHGGFATGTPTADLQVLFHAGKSTLTYRVQIAQFEPGSDPAKPVSFIDAVTGAELWSYDNLHREILVDDDKQTRDMKNGTNYSAAVQATSADAVAADAHAHAGQSLAYLTAAHGRDSFDDAGAKVDSYVHYGRRYVNAFWDGLRLTFGDGDGRKSRPLVSLDIVAHELGHGVMEHTANLIYANESGALNEANSDILAAATEAFAGRTRDEIWMVGEDVWLQDPNLSDTRPAALRYMDDPALAGDYDYYPTRYTGTADGGGVHSNSGIANLFFQLLSDGGGHPRGKTSVVVTGIGIQLAADIWYEAISHRMTPWASFADARIATVAAAADLDAPTLADENPDNDTTYAASVAAAWDAVGVTHAPLAYETVSSTLIDPAIAEGETRQLGPFSSTGLSAMRFVLQGSTGDGDLYVKAGSAPTTSSYDCVSAGSSTLEMCELVPPNGGAYFVMVHAWGNASTHPGAVSAATLEVLGIEATCETSETSCTDGLDEDCDASSDCDDADCATDAACLVSTCTPAGDPCGADPCCGVTTCRTKGKYAGKCW